MISLAEELEQQVKGWRANFGLSHEFGKIINQQQDKIISLQQENKRLKREIWNLKKTKGKRK